LRGFLFKRGFEMGKVDHTLFLLRQGRDILIVQVYVDDIAFGGSSNSFVARFAEDMSREFEMRMMSELQFFLGLQIKQSKEGTFVHQATYTKSDFGEDYTHVPLQCDSTSAISIPKNPMLHSKLST
jgi:hypothetical protein